METKLVHNNSTELVMFENYLRLEKQLAHLTVIAYMRDLVGFEKYLNEDIINAKMHDIRSYIVQMVEKGDAAKSVNRRISALRVFFKFSLFKEIITTDPTQLIQNVKQPKKIPTFIPEIQLQKIFEDYHTIDYDDLLSFTVLYTLYSTGLRRSEIAQLNHSNVDLEQGVIKVVGKGSKTRLIPISEELKNVLKEYVIAKTSLLHSLEATQNDQNICKTQKNALFLTHNNKALTHNNIYEIIKKIATRFGLPKNCSPHTLRHTFATHLMNQKVSIRTIQSLLGHESIATTQIYTHTSTEELKNVFTNAHPRA